MQKTRKFRITIEGEVFIVEVAEERIERLRKILEREERKEEAPAPKPYGENLVLAPMAGKVVSLKKTSGDSISKGEVIAILESMKTLVEIKSDKEGVIEEVLVKEGDFVNFNQPIFRLKTS
ncbi:MAG: hypothetical protein DRJ51_06735 [Thermoprotei archaeon]|nr:MAG: hypothetical protein DRJ51_06735 [Thermoprotei archaeon]RLF01697.1 MAG: hypothetical protein DRJ59_05505 [Thermoprotei archaeon]